MEETRKRIITEQDVKFLIAIVVFLAPIFVCYFGIKEDLALIKQELNTIKTNDLAHIEIQLQAMKSRNDIQDARTIELGLNVERLMTLEGIK